MSLSEDGVIEIIGAEHFADYKLKLRFRDGVERVIDFEPFLRSSRNPMIRAYLEGNRFVATKDATEPSEERSRGRGGPTEGGSIHHIWSRFEQDTGGLRSDGDRR